jgi:lauroyl/myristoyl acyltransferase
MPKRLELVEDFIQSEIGSKYPYQFAIHNPKAMDGNDQPHVHLMFNERLQDGIERDPEQYFKRYNSRILNVAELKRQYRQELPGTKNRY